MEIHQYIAIFNSYVSLPEGNQRQLGIPGVAWRGALLAGYGPRPHCNWGTTAGLPWDVPQRLDWIWLYSYYIYHSIPMLWCWDMLGIIIFLIIPKWIGESQVRMSLIDFDARHEAAKRLHVRDLAPAAMTSSAGCWAKALKPADAEAEPWNQENCWKMAWRWMMYVL